MIPYLTGIIGTVIFMDGLFSIILYTGKLAYHGEKQTWRRDHSIRIVRMVLGFTLIIFGGRI